MADEQQTSVAVLEPQTTETTPDPGINLEAAHAAAQAFLDSKNEPEATPPARQRDEHGRFVGKESTAEEPAPPAPSTPAPTVAGIDPLWIEAAKAEGVMDAASYRSEADLQAAIAERRDMLAFRQWRQYQGNQPPVVAQQPPVQQQTPPGALEDFKLTIPEDELAPEVAAQLKGMADYVNKLKANLSDSQALKTEVEALKGVLQQQSAVQAYYQNQAEQASFWDTVAPNISGYVDHFGKPSELLTISDPNSERLREVQVFNQLYFEPAWQKYGMLNDRNPKKLELAIRDAWNAYPLAAANGRNGTNGKQNGAPGNGSVVRPGNPRTAIGEAPLPDGANLDAELNRVLAHAGGVWDSLGGNPFKHSGSPLA